MAEPTDICIWALPRTGSTYIQQAMAGALWRSYGFSAKNLQEAVGHGGFIPNWLEAENIIDFSDALDSPIDENAQDRYFNWYINDEQELCRRKAVGNPLSEVAHRAALIKAGEWKNNVVFKSMRWSVKCRMHGELNELYDNAILNSNKPMHHIVTWRRNTLDAIASWMVMRSIKQSHGNYAWDGTPIDFNAYGFKAAQLETYQEFASLLSRLDTSQTVLIEMNSFDRLTTIEWPDGTEIDFPEAEKAKNYVNHYININDGKLVKPINMLSKDALADAKRVYTELELKTHWSRLDKHIGLKSYG